MSPLGRYHGMTITLSRVSLRAPLVDTVTMANITQFHVPFCVTSVIPPTYCLDGIVNAVQSALNEGVNLKGSSKSGTEWKTVKDDMGNERQVIVVKTKSSERLQLNDTMPSRFYGWCLAIETAQAYGHFNVTIPECFIAWFDKRFKNEAKAS